MVSSLPHPYYPLDLSLPHYIPNTQSFSALIGAWLLFVFTANVVSYLFLATSPRRLTFTDRLTAHWFFMCGFIHLFFEGHFALHHHTLAGRRDFFSEEWREYSQADSRYLSSDTFVVSMEAVTALAWGPLSFWLVYAIWGKRPERHVFIALVSLGQIYGNVLYFATAILGGLKEARPEWLYFWVYFVGLNGVWMVVPSILGTRAVKAVVRATSHFESTSEKKRL